MAADRIVDHLGSALALQSRKRFREETVLIVDGTLVPTRDHTIAEQSKNYRQSTNHWVSPTPTPASLSPSAGPCPGNRNDCKAWELSGAKDSVGRTTVIADGGYRSTGLVILHRHEPGQTELQLVWRPGDVHHAATSRGGGTRLGGQPSASQISAATSSL